MDAVTSLTDDHRRMKKLLKELDQTTEQGIKIRGEVFAAIREELFAHESIEEEIFYPALKEHPKAKDIVLEGIEEHHVVDGIVAELDVLPVTDEAWEAKATVMRENVEHHMEEEETDMFKRVRSIFSEQELHELGGQMESRKRELLGT